MQNHAQVHEALKWLMNEHIFTGISLHGNTSWDCSPVGLVLRTGLRTALIDDYERMKLKAGRYKPNKKSKPSCGEPVIERATKEQRTCLCNLPLQIAALKLVHGVGQEPGNQTVAFREKCRKIF